MFILLILVFFLCGPAVAEEQYPCDQSEHGSGKISNEVHPAYLTRRYLEGGSHAFDIPYAYFYVWLSADTLNCNLFGFDLAFWMPSLAPFEKHAFKADGSPMEYPPGDGYLIRISHLRTIPDDNSFIGVAFSILAYDLQSSRDRVPYEYGLVRISPEEHWMDEYVFLDEEPRDTVFQCTSGECTFTFFFRDLKIAVNGSFPRGRLSEWRAVKAGTKTLLERFIVKEPPGPPLKQAPIQK
jgi:hypothetical protein